MMETRYIDIIPPGAAETEREKRSAMEGKLAALVLAAFLIGGGMGLSAGLRAGEYRAAMQYAEHQIDMAQAERENAEEMVRQYREEYRDAVWEIAEMKREREEMCVVLDEPEPGTYDAEFGWDFDYVVRVMGGECRGEPFEGMLALAQCIKDTAEQTGMTPEEVVKVPGQYSAPVGREVLDGMELVNEAALQVFRQGVRVTEEPIEFFYSTRNGGYSAWHERELRFVCEIGNHRFFARA